MGIWGGRDDKDDRAGKDTELPLRLETRAGARESGKSPQTRLTLQRARMISCGLIVSSGFLAFRRRVKFVS